MNTDGTAYHLGIDLGTTYVAAGILQQGRPEIITLGDRTPVLPSVLYFRADGEVLTGESATRRGLNDPTRVVREFKRRVGDPTPLIVGQTPYSVDALMAKLLRFVHDAVVEGQGGAPQSIAVTHPANWGPYKIDVLEQAVRIAGIGDVTTITEPVAAAIHYAAAERMEPGETVAVYDLGGGTFDAAVLRKTDGDFTVLGEVEGIERLGGIDFDEAVFQHVVRFCESSLTELDVDDPVAIQALTRLRQECVEAKEVLSTDTEVTIPVVLPNLQTEVRLTRAEFEAMIRPLLRQTVEALVRAISSAGVDPRELSAVLLVGGCSRIPLISEMVGAELGRPIAVDRHPKHTVALGAAISAGRSAEAQAPQVDDWFRTDPTTSVPLQPGPGPGSGPAAALAAGVGSGAINSNIGDPLSMFPLKNDGAAPVHPDQAVPDAAPSPPAVSPAPAPAARIGTVPVELPPPAAPVTTAAAAVAASIRPSPLSFSSSNPTPDSFSNAATGSYPSAYEAAPSFSEHHVRMSTEPSRPGGRILVLAAAALAAFLILGGTALAITRDPSPSTTEVAAGPGGEQQDGADPGAPNSAPTGETGAASDGQAAAETGNQGNLGDQGQIAPQGRTDTTVTRTNTGDGVTTTHRGTATSTAKSTTTAPASTTTLPTTTTTHDMTTTTAETTTTSTTTSTTAPEAEPIRIVSGPKVNSRSGTSFQFNYTTNDVCGTGSFTVAETATGRSVGSFRGQNVCAGPLHGGFPNGGAAAFAGFDLAPGTTYRVTVTVKGTAGDGTRPAGQGSDTATFEVTTTE